MKPDYTVLLDTPQELNQSSYIQTGLYELERQGIITLKVTLNSKLNLGRIIISDSGEITKNNQAHPKTSFYRVIHNKDKTELFFATDLYDFANHFSTEALEKCDYIFKRSFERNYVDVLPDHFKSKIYKMGLTFCVHSKDHDHQFKYLIGLFTSNLKINFKLDRFVFKRLLKTFYTQQNNWKFSKSIRKIDRFENYNLGKNNSILYQTRCFIHENDDDVLGIHQQRYHIIKLLRKNFPNYFMGGFVPSKIASKKYEDALTNVPTAPEKYLNALKNTKIVVYTRGLANSPAWKMAEYLSQGKVIIAEPLTTQLPVPLQHGKEILLFNNDEELILNINKVLVDKELSDSLSINARKYFETHVHPTQNVKRILDFMILNSKK